MLSIATRNRFATLLDAITLRECDERPAIIYRETNHEPNIISRRLFRERVRDYATSLAAIGIHPRDLVVIAHTQNLESIYSFWAVLALGAIPSMFPTLTEKLDPVVYMDSMAKLTRLSGVAAVVTTDEFAPVLRNNLSCAVYGSSELITGGLAPTTGFSTSQFVLQPAAADIAFLQHSSGTTGLQKGVALSHDAVLNQIAAYSDTIRLRKSDVIASWLPLYHDMGLIAGFLLPLIQGIPLILMSPFDWVAHPSLLFRAIHEHGATLCWLPNFAYNHCARRIRSRDIEGLSLTTMRLFVNCSEPVRHDSHHMFIERFAGNGARPEMLGVSYAMAENTFAVTQTIPGQLPVLDMIDADQLIANKIAIPSTEDDPSSVVKVSCGPAIPGTEIRIVDSNSQAVSDRMVGEISIRSNCLLKEYYRRPDLQPLDDGGWFSTGDMGYLANGELFVIGRRKDLIISAGKNIYPADIEAIVNEVSGVRAGRVVAFGVEDEREGTEVVAVVAETMLEDENQKRAIGRAIRQEIARQSMITVTYVHLVGPKWLLKTSSGKIARGANKDKWLREEFSVVNPHK